MEPTKFDPAKRAFSFWREFRSFAFKGNVIDLAVGVVIGTSFAKIIDSLVKNLIMPMIGIILPSEQSYHKWTATVGSVDVPYGLFIADLVNFLLIALAVYLFIVRFLGWIMRARQEEAKANAPLTKEQALLTEIRDLLSNDQRRKVADA